MSDNQSGKGDRNRSSTRRFREAPYWKAMAERLAQAATSEKSLPESVKDESRKASARDIPPQVLDTYEDERGVTVVVIP